MYDVRGCTAHGRSLVAMLVRIDFANGYTSQRHREMGLQIKTFL